MHVVILGLMPKNTGSTTRHWPKIRPVSFITIYTFIHIFSCISFNNLIINTQYCPHTVRVIRQYVILNLFTHLHFTEYVGFLSRNQNHIISLIVASHSLSYRYYRLVLFSKQTFIFSLFVFFKLSQGTNNNKFYNE